MMIMIMFSFSYKIAIKICYCSLLPLHTPGYCVIPAVRKHACLRSSVTPSVLMVSENGMGMPAIVGDATGGKVHRRWWLPIRIDSDLLLLRERPLWQNQLCKADRQSESNDCQAWMSVVVSDTYNWVSSAYCCMPTPNVSAIKLIGDE